MMPGPLDHLIAVVFGVAFPIVAYIQYERRRPALAADQPGARVREYVDTIAWLGGMGVASVAVWGLAERPWASLGLGSPPLNAATITVFAVVAATALFFAWQLRLLRTDERAREMLRTQAAHVDEYLPRTAREGRVFHGVALSAGLGEELFFRGFLTWYLGAFLAPIAAVVATAVLFASAHVMHGVPAALRAGVLGLAFSGIYAWTGTLHGAMALHALIDWFAGRAALQRDRTPAPR